MTRKQLVLVGAGDLGREVFVWFAGIDPAQRDWEVKGFLDANRHCPKVDDLKVPLLGCPDDYEPADNDVFVCTVGKTKPREQVCDTIERRGGRFISLVHPSALLAPDVTIGFGCILFPSVVIDTKCIIEDHVTVYFGSTVGHDASVGRASVLQPGSKVGSASVLGRGVTMSTNSCTLPGIRLGEFATVGASSLAVRDVPSGTTVLGVPGRPLRALGTGIR